MDFEHTGVVIPAYNVADQLKDVLSKVIEFVPRKRVCVVDDGSEDGTAEAAEAFGIVPVRHPENRGKGEAIKTGFRLRLALGDEAVFTLDGDGQHDPGRMPSFLDLLQKTGCDVVVGSRSFRIGEMPPDRIFSNLMSSLAVSMVAGVKIPDSQCGFRLFRRRVLENVFPVTSRYETETEMLVLAYHKGYSIGWCPVTNRYSGQKSHIRRFYDTIRFLRLMSRFVE
jgi:glycosyltransferase involved in cell wall biosynthesis